MENDLPNIKTILVLFNQKIAGSLFQFISFATVENCFKYRLGKNHLHIIYSGVDK